MTDGPSRARLWWLGARPRTLGASITPVVVGTAAAGTATWPRTVGALLVGLGFQIGVNYLNDYSDGVRGVDTGARAGPMRLTASGAVPARAVLAAGIGSLLIAAIAGVLLAAATSWWLLAVGAAAIAAAIGYSGGPRPYGSAGLGELSVFVFFGLVATAGTAYVHAERIRTEAWWASIPMGLLAVAILIANNLRDIPTDAATGKRTLAVRLGDPATRALYRVVLVAALLAPVVGVIAGGLPGAALLALTAVPLAAGPWRTVGTAVGRELVPVLQITAMLQIHLGAMLAIGLWFGT